MSIPALSRLQLGSGNLASFGGLSVSADALKIDLDKIKASFEKTNLYDLSEIQDGRFIASNGSGSLNSSAAWACTAFIPVTAGSFYTISHTGARRDGVQFYTATNDSSAITGSYTAGGASPLTVLAPVDAQYMVVNIRSTSQPIPDNLVIEQGEVAGAVDYTLLTDALPLTHRPLPLSFTDSSSALLVLGDTYSYIETKIDSNIVRVGIDPFREESNDKSTAFNFDDIYVNGVLIKRAVDDIAPYRVFGTTVGANHGYIASKCPVSAHGKTVADIGSVYTDGTSEWVIVDVTDADTIRISSRLANSSIANNAVLIHVSGGTNTAMFNAGNATSAQWYPAYKNYQKSITLDGGTDSVTETGKYYYQKQVVITESYDLMLKTDIMEWLVTNAGFSEEPSEYAADGSVSISMQYVFTTDGNCVIYTDFYALKNVAEFQDIMFLQCSEFESSSFGENFIYIPKALPFTHESVAYDFNAIENLSNLSIVGSRMNFTHDRCEPSGILCDRVLQMNSDLGLSMGYLPIKDADPASRRNNASSKALQINNSNKIYMSCIDGLQTSLTAGDYFSVVGYKALFSPGTDRIGSYMVETNDAYYLYCDWSAALIDRLPLPVSLAGKAMTVIEKSSSVTVRTQSTNSILIEATESGYLVGRFDK